MWRVDSLEKTDTERDSGQEEKGTTEDEMAGWHHWLDGRESEWTPGVGDGQGGLACCNSWGCKESDMTEQLNWTELNWHHRLAAMNVACSSLPLSLEYCSQQNGSVVTWESCYPILQVAMANDRLTQGTEGWSLFLRGGTVLWYNLYPRIPYGIKLKLDPGKTSRLLHSFHYPILLSSFLFSVPEEITCLRTLISGFSSEECNLR